MKSFFKLYWDEILLFIMNISIYISLIEFRSKEEIFFGCIIFYLIIFAVLLFIHIRKKKILEDFIYENYLVGNFLSSVVFCLIYLIFFTKQLETVLIVVVLINFLLFAVIHFCYFLYILIKQIYLYKKKEVKSVFYEQKQKNIYLLLALNLFFITLSLFKFNEYIFMYASIIDIIFLITAAFFFWTKEKNCRNSIPVLFVFGCILPFLFLFINNLASSTLDDLFVIIFFFMFHIVFIGFFPMLQWGINSKLNRFFKYIFYSLYLTIIALSIWIILLIKDYEERLDKRRIEEMIKFPMSIEDAKQKDLFISYYEPEIKEFKIPPEKVSEKIIEAFSLNPADLDDTVVFEFKNVWAEYGHYYEKEKIVKTNIVWFVIEHQYRYPQCFIEVDDKTYSNKDNTYDFPYRTFMKFDSIRDTVYTSVKTIQNDSLIQKIRFFRQKYK